MESYEIEGYGIRAKDITTTKERVEALLQLAPKLNDTVHDYFAVTGVKNPKLDDYLDYGECVNGDMAYLLQQVIQEVENVKLEIVEDFNDDNYLLLCPKYPWFLTEEEKMLDTQDKMDNLFRKYISVLTDDDIDIDYETVEDCD